VLTSRLHVQTSEQIGVDTLEKFERA
jgi:hypothetical protein